jgi:hypothetical protein
MVSFRMTNGASAQNGAWNLTEKQLRSSFSIRGLSSRRRQIGKRLGSAGKSPSSPFLLPSLAEQMRPVKKTAL